MALENVVIAYTADISDIKQKVTQISSINRQLANKLGSDFSKGFNVISSELKKIQFDKEFKIKISDKEFKKVRGTISTFEKTVQTADGQLFKFTETVGKSGKNAVKLSSSINKVAQSQNKLIGASSKLSTNFSNLKNVNSSFSKQLGSMGQVSKLVGTSLNQLSDDGSKVSKIFETTNGKFVQLTQTTKRLPNGVQNVTRSLKQLSKAQAQNANTIERNGKSTRGFTANLKTLVGRALLTIPVWFALRSAISGVFRTIRNGLKDLVLFDRALQKLRRNMEATSTDLEADFERIEKVITSFSLKTGKSTEAITNAIQKFATVGFDLETSLVGGIEATKLAITLFGDVEGTAQAFARSLRVLTEDIESAEEKQIAISEALALTDQLWQTNAFEINEFSQNLTKFAGTANIANLSIEDTLTLLATLSTGGLANRAGRLLRSTLLRALQNIEKVTRELDLDFDPKSQPTIQFILSLVARLKELRTAENIPVELASVLGELFTVRSTEVVASLVSLEKTLKENIALTPDVEKFNDTFERILKTTGSLAEQFTNINKEIGKAFVTGLTGGEDFNKFLQRLIPQLKDLRETAETVGFAVNSFAQTLKLVIELLDKFPNPFKSFKDVIVANKQLSDLQLKLIQITDKTAEFGDALQEGLSGKLEGRALKALIVEVEHRLELEKGINVNLIKSLVVLKEQVQEEERINELKEEEETKEEALAVAGRKRKEIAELVLKNELEILKNQGASASQLALVEQAGRKRLDIEKTIIGQLEDQLNKEKEINEEKRLRSQIGAESLKLFRIAQKEGKQEARIIGEVLSGQRDFDNFIRAGGKAVDIFKKQFADVFEQQQALRFFRGDTVPGQRGLRGGADIPISEEAVRGVSARGLTLEQRRAENLFKRIEGSGQTNKDALNANTKAITDLSLSLDEFDKAILARGGRISGEDVVTRNEISRLRNIEAVQRRAVPQTILPTASQAGTSKIDLTINIDGKNLNLVGRTPEEIRELAKQISPAVTARIEEALQVFTDNIKNNPNSDEAQAVDERINEF